MNKLIFIAISILLILIFTAPIQASTWYVNKDGTGDFEFITVAVGNASTGDTILVAPGYYHEITIYLNRKAIHLISEAGPDSTTIHLARITLDYVTVIIIDETYTNSCSIIGFTIRGARYGSLTSGGGICCGNSNVLIKNNIITDNWCSTGGAIACHDYDSPWSPIIENNLIHTNSAWVTGGIDIINSSPIIRNNTIVNNYSSDGPSAIRIAGGSSHPIISNNIIVDNTSGWSEGGAVASGTPEDQITFECNDVWNNSPYNYQGTIGDQTGINGNISLDPLFCGIPGSNNYFLQEDSPCAEANVPGICFGNRMGKYPVNCTVGVKSESWGSMKSLFSKEKENEQN